MSHEEETAEQQAPTEGLPQLERELVEQQAPTKGKVVALAAFQVAREV